MKSKNIILLLLLVIGSIFITSAQKRTFNNWELENIPEIPQRIKDRQNQYNSTRNARLLGWLPNDKGVLISTRFGQYYQLHMIKTPNGARQQLTFFREDGITNALFRPQHNGFLMRKDASEGGENYQFLYFDLEKRDYQLITDGNSNHLQPIWSADGTQLAYSSAKKNSVKDELFIYEMTTQQEQDFELGTGAWYAMDWHENGTLLLVNQQESKFSIHLFDPQNQQLKPVQIEGRTELNLNQLSFNQKGNGIYFSTDAINGTQHLFHYALDTKELINITESLSFEMDNFWQSQDKKVLLFSTNENGLNPIFQVNQTNFSFDKINQIPEGLVYGLHISPDNKRMGFVLNNAQTAGDIYEYNFSSKEIIRWTSSEVGGLDTDNFSAGAFFTYPSFDSINGQARPIPAFIYKPKNAKAPHPVLINIHGGPQLQHLPYFSSNIQFMTNELGIAVIGPNVRGSVGYGQEYLDLDNGFKRENAVKDIGKLLDWIATQPDLDASRIAVYGGSYGGYMTLASMVHYNDRIKCGIDLVGVSDWVTFLENTRDSGRERRRSEYGDERIPEVRAFLKKISPLTNAQKITKPLLVAQGLNDPRVPAGQSEKMVSKIRENGGEVWYMLANDEGHSFRSRANINYFRQVLMLFLEEHLLERETE